jgi:hypothetical protein
MAKRLRLVCDTAALRRESHALGVNPTTLTLEFQPFPLQIQWA